MSIEKLTLEALIAILNEVDPRWRRALNDTHEMVTEKTNLINNFGMDSLDKIDLIMLLEKRYRIEIPDEDADGLETLGDVLTYVNAKSASPPP